MVNFVSKSLFISSVLIIHAVSILSVDSSAGMNSTVSNSSWVIFQSFNWDVLSDRSSLYVKIQNAASSLYSAGIDAIWFPPPSQSVDTQGYLPQQWYELVGETNLLNAINTVTGLGMSAIADIVINHRTAPNVDSCTHHYTSYVNPAWGSWAVAKNDENCVGTTSCCGNTDTGEGLTYAPDLGKIKLL